MALQSNDDVTQLEIYGGIGAAAGAVGLAYGYETYNPNYKAEAKRNRALHKQQQQDADNNKQNPVSASQITESLVDDTPAEYRHKYTEEQMLDTTPKNKRQLKRQQERRERGSRSRGVYNQVHDVDAAHAMANSMNVPKTPMERKVASDVTKAVVKAL